MMKKKYTFDDERASLFAALETWHSDALGGGASAFHGGATPDFADVMTYGVLRAIQHTTTFADVMKEHAAAAAWYERMTPHVPARVSSINGKAIA
jgi:hypothetical protein